MKHLVIIPVYVLLLVLSFVIGGICYLYSFNKEHFFVGTRFINKKIVKFANWYNV